MSGGKPKNAIPTRDHRRPPRKAVYRCPRCGEALSSPPSNYVCPGRMDLDAPLGNRAA